MVYKILLGSGIINNLRIKLHLENLGNTNVYNNMFEQLCDKVIKLDDKLKIGIVGK